MHFPFPPRLTSVVAILGKICTDLCTLSPCCICFFFWVLKSFSSAQGKFAIASLMCIVMWVCGSSLISVRNGLWCSWYDAQPEEAQALGNGQENIDELGQLCYLNFNLIDQVAIQNPAPLLSLVKTKNFQNATAPQISVLLEWNFFLLFCFAWQSMSFPEIFHRINWINIPYTSTQIHTFLFPSDATSELLFSFSVFACLWDSDLNICIIMQQLLSKKISRWISFFF